MEKQSSYLQFKCFKKNVDLCLFDKQKDQFNSTKQSCHYSAYIALEELKGGIDPADEHWETANSALERIRRGFQAKQLKPFTFFVAASIEKAMAAELYAQLKKGITANAANLKNEDQVISLCRWLNHM